MWTPGSSIQVSDYTVYEYTHNSNQLRVLLCPVSGASVCAYMRVVNAGSKDEAAFVPSGAAHFIEHMSFRINDGKIWSLASKGDVINAETNLDSTRFYVVHLPEQTNETIRIDAARFAEKSVPASKVPIERNAVLNELERGEQAGNKMFRTTSSVAILEHSYHTSTIGTRSDVMNTKAIDMEHFRKKFYVPNNTTLIFSGSFNPSTVLDTVDAHFGHMQMGLECNPIHTPEPVQLGKRTVDLNIPSPCPMLCMAFRQPAASTKESLVMQLISRLTWNNKEGRAKHLIDSNVLHDVSTYSPRQMEPYLWFFHGTMERNSPDIEQLMLETLQTFATSPVSQSILTSQKKNLQDEWNRSTESVTDIMNELGRSVSIGNWADFECRSQIMDSITSEDIMHVAANVFIPQNMTVTRVIPTKSTVKELKTTALEELNELATSPPIEQLSIQTSSLKKDWKMVQISPAMNILHAPRANFARVTLSARFSPAQHDVASLFVSNLGNGLSSNGQTNTARLMAMHTERTFSHDHEFIHMSMSMPLSSSVLKKASDIMFNSEWSKPIFDNKRVELEKRRLMSELSSLCTEQKFQVKSHFIQNLFEKTLYHIPIQSRVERLQSYSSDDLRLFHQKWFNSDNVYVTMVSPTMDAATIMGEIFPTHNKTPTTTLAWVASERKDFQKNIFLQGYGSFEIMIGQTVDTKGETKVELALHCAAEILGGGMTGRLMHTVREQRGLGTYGIYSVLQTVSDETPRVFCVQGTFSPASIKEGMECTRQLINEWHAHGVTPKELENAKDRMIGSRVIAADTIDNLHSMVVKDILNHKKPKYEFERFKENVRALTLKDVNDAILKYIDPTKLTSIVVGPPGIFS